MAQFSLWQAEKALQAATNTLRPPPLPATLVTEAPRLSGAPLVRELGLPELDGVHAWMAGANNEAYDALLRCVLDGAR